MDILSAKRRKSIISYAQVMLLTALLGLYVGYVWRNVEREHNAKIFQIARSIEACLSQENIMALSNNDSDLTKSQYLSLKSALTAAIKVNPEARFAYIYIERDGKIFFAVDSEPMESTDYSPPGQEYAEAKNEDKQPFRDGKELLTHELTDRWGTWTSALVPIKNEATGETIAVFGMDFNSTSWDKNLLSKVIQSTFIVFLFFAILLMLKFKTKNKVLNLEISERKKAEEELRKSLEHNKALLRANPDLMFVFDTKCVIVDFHSELTEQLYIPADQFLGEPIDRIFPADIAEMIHQKVNAVLSTGQLDYSNYSLEMIDGLKYFEARYVLCGSEHVLAIVRDITSTKKAEEDLRISEEKYRILTESLKDVVWIYDTQLQMLTYISPSVEKLRGYTAEEVMSQPFQFSFLNEDSERRMSIINERIEEFSKNPDTSNTFFTDELQQPCKDGTTIWIEMIYKCYLNTKTNHIEIRGVSREITERKKWEAEIVHKNKELQELNVTKDKFFTIIAHDLRSPFSSFLGLTKLMAEDVQNMPLVRVQEMAMAMSKSAQNLYRLLENLLQWAQMKKNTVPFEPKKVRLWTVVNESILMVQETANAKGIKIICSIPSELDIVADIHIVQTIIRNLVTNGVKYTHKGGEVSVSATKTNGFVVVAVKDTGIGMSESIIGNLFRIDKAKNRRGTAEEPSTGLGLVLCKEFVEKHGGKIWVESHDGSQHDNSTSGTTFYFTLPCHEISTKN